jgi:hypothetical protein
VTRSATREREGWLFDGPPEAPPADPNRDQEPEEAMHRRMLRRDLREIGVDETFAGGDFVAQRRRS